MSFIWVDMLWLLLFLPLLVLAYILIQKRRHKFALRYSSLSLIKEISGRNRRFRQHIPPALFLVAMAAVIFALARPAGTITLLSQRATIILAIDTSLSMRATDIQPNRLEAAKSAADAFVQKEAKDVRIGVVSFSGTTALVQAPTTDHLAVTQAIDRLYVQSRTAIGNGILTSLDAIFEQPGGKSAAVSGDTLSLYNEITPAPTPTGTAAPAVIVLLSDGQSNTGPAPLDIIDQATNRGVRIFTVGMGTSAGTLPGFGGGPGIRVSLDETTLKKIALDTGGKYFKAENSTALYNIYQSIGTQLVFEKKQTELTVFFSGLAALLVIISGSLSLLWFYKP
jgi:Ca-activated chloride channel homolog